MNVNLSLLLLGLVVGGSFFVGTVAGFGSVVLALALGAIAFDVKWMLGWLVPMNFVFYVYLVARGWKWLSWRTLGTRFLPAMVPGLVVGAVATHFMSATAMAVVFAAFVLAVGVWELRAVLSSAGPRPALPPLVRMGALFCAGLIQGAFASGGPLVVFVASRELTDKHVFRATLNGLWALLNLLLLPRLLADGTLNVDAAGTGALMLVPALAGVTVGERLHARIEPAAFRKLVAWLLVVAAAALVVSSAVKVLRSGGAP